MAKLVFGMNQSLDGYVDHQEFAPPSPTLFRHFIDQVRGLTGSVYGRRLYAVMSYWDEDRPEWSPKEGEFAAAWRRQQKQHVGEIAVGGPDLARSLTDLGLIDEYRLYLHPVVLGRGKPFFAGPR